MSATVRRTVKVELLGGLHLRPASMIAHLVAQSPCNVRILNGEKTANAGDVFDLMGLNAGHGTELSLEAEGDGSAELLEAIIPYFQIEDAGGEEEEDETAPG